MDKEFRDIIIGYAWVKPSDLWDARLAQALSNKEDYPMEKAPSAPVPAEPTLTLSEGRLTPDQVDLILKHLPVDITYVDENDQVRYYSDAKERIFPRSPAVIGRAVQNCHPPKSLHVVNDIVAAFKEKKKDVAEFWIQRNGQFILIRYFPVYDEAGVYRGVLEVSQEISRLKKLEGEKRLLDWK